jgi:hypothetical protein
MTTINQLDKYNKESYQIKFKIHLKNRLNLLTDNIYIYIYIYILPTEPSQCRNSIFILPIDFHKLVIGQ